MATTACRARISPAEPSGATVRTRTPPATRSNPVTRGSASCRTAPRSCATRASPRASFAGLSITQLSGCQAPAVQRGEWTSARAASPSRKTARSPWAVARSTLLAELVDLARMVGQAQLAGLLELALDPVRPGEVDDRAQVRHPLALEEVHLVGVVAQAVLQPVREARLAEAAVPPAGPEAPRAPSPRS